MAKPGQNKGNTNAAKPKALRRIQWTQTLSGDRLQQFYRYLHIDPSSLDSEERVKTEARRLFEEMIDQLPEDKEK